MIYAQYRRLSGVAVLLLHKYGLGYYIAVVVCFAIFDEYVSMIKAMFHVKHWVIIGKHRNSVLTEEWIRCFT